MPQWHPWGHSALTVQAENWWATHPVDPDWVEVYRKSDRDPQRGWIVEALKTLPPWRTLFELGCHCGPQLAAIQRVWPEALLSGCDVNREAVEAGRLAFPGITLGAFPAVTQALPDQSVDVVLSCYALAYIGPREIERALIEAGRLARRAIVICDPIAHGWAQACEYTDVRYAEWRHPYVPLLHRPEFHNWTANFEPASDGESRLSGVLTVIRP